MRLERSQDWINEAEQDLLHAKHDCTSKFYNWACFSAQQSSEKAVKAVFKKMGAEVWGHSIVGLLRELAAKVKIPEKLFKAAQELDKAYIPTRYPDALPSGSPSELYNKDEAERLIKYAEKIILFCKGLLSQI